MGSGNDISEIVRQSYNRCLKEEGFLDKFHERFLSSSEEVKQKFAKTDFAKQKQLLKHTLDMSIMFANGDALADKVIKRVRDSHNFSHLDIKPHLYSLWKDTLIDTVNEFDKDCDSNILLAWDMVLMTSIDYILSGYGGRKTG